MENGSTVSKTGCSDKAFMPICHYKTRINDTSQLLNVVKIDLDFFICAKSIALLE